MIPKILIVDKQRSVRNILREKLEFEEYMVKSVETLSEAFALYSEYPYQVVIGDEAMLSEYIESPDRFAEAVSLIITSDSASIDSVISAIRLGAYDFISKPIDMNYLLMALRNLVKETPSLSVSPAGSAKQSIAPVARPAKSSSNVEHIIGDSRSIKHVKELIDKVAPSDARVLVTGPNGSGKELIAQWLHEKSSRRSSPFVEVNCAAIPSELIESELFGHEKGAFTSAIRQRKGKFEQANGGTLFLDEIGDMSLSAQAKVLRVLQESRLSRVGSDKDISVDVRIVAATNKDLMKEIENGNFREDLYHRLSVIVINVPPLAERVEDIPKLVAHFVEKISAEYGIVPKRLDRDAIECLKEMDWSGNIRELRNVIERLIILCGDDKITSADVRTYTQNN